MLDENAPHHLSVAQPAPHPPAPDDADSQGLAVLPEELHSVDGTDLRFRAGTFVITEIWDKTIWIGSLSGLVPISIRRALLSLAVLTLW